MVLLDVNVLVALLDANHIHHSAAALWFSANRAAGWATCPITENGVLRTLSRPGYSDIYRDFSDLRDVLVELCSDGYHTFWHDAVTLRDDRLPLTGVTSRNSTDIYLLALAVSNRGSLATFDQRIPAAALGGAGVEALKLIPT